MLGSLGKEIGFQIGRYDWLLTFCQYQLPHSTIKQRIVMFRVIVCWPLTKSLHIRQSFPVKCTYSQPMLLQLRTCFVSLLLRRTNIHSENTYSINSRWSPWKWCSSCNVCARGGILNVDFRINARSTHWFSHQGGRHYSPFYSRPQNTDKCITSCCEEHMLRHIERTPRTGVHPTLATENVAHASIW